MSDSFERRKLELFLALNTFGFGAWLLFSADAMAGPPYRHLLALASEPRWGGMFLTNGLAHCLWLAVNGARWWSPIVRFWAAFFSGCLYLVWSAAFAAYDPASTAVYTYAALSVGAFACCVFAWRDALTAVRLRRAVLDHA